MSKIQINNDHNIPISICLMFLYEERKNLLKELNIFKEKYNREYIWLNKDQIKFIKVSLEKYIINTNRLLKINMCLIEKTRSKLVIC